MNIYKHIKIAEEMGLPIHVAVNGQRRFLMNELYGIDQEIAIYKNYEGDVDNEYFALYCQSDAELRHAQITTDLRALKRITLPKAKDSITDEMIEQARNFPVERLF